MDENVSMTAVENRVEVAAIAMMNAERDVRGRHGLVFTDCRVLARLAIEAVDALSTAPASPVAVEDAFWRVVYPIIGWEYDVVIKWPESQWEEMVAEDDDGALADRARERQFAKKIKEALASIPTPTAGREHNLVERDGTTDACSRCGAETPEDIAAACTYVSDGELYARGGNRSAPTAGRAEALEEVLLEVEWKGTPGYCPSCGNHNSEGHAKDCKLNRALSSAPTHQAVTVDDALILEWAEELSIEANRADSGDGWILTATGIAARDQARKRLAILTAASPQRREDDAPRYSYARSSGVWAVWDRSTTTCIKQCADENEAEKLCNKLNAQRREE